MWQLKASTTHALSRRMIVSERVRRVGPREGEISFTLIDEFARRRQHMQPLDRQDKVPQHQVLSIDCLSCVGLAAGKFTFCSSMAVLSGESV